MYKKTIKKIIMFSLFSIFIILFYNTSFCKSDVIIQKNSNEFNPIFEENTNNDTISNNNNYINKSSQVYQSKDDAYKSFFGDFYSYVINYKKAGLQLTKKNIYSLEDFYAYCSKWLGGTDGMPQVGELLGKYYFKKDTGGNLENQTIDDGFIGYCLYNKKHVELIHFLCTFFSTWRFDEEYVGIHGYDFLADPYASMVDTAKFFYYEKETIPKFIYVKKNVPNLYDFFEDYFVNKESQ
ncbi:MAG: hypothetical protein Q4F88_00200 [Eubacteriales bacterium]|nr:hypothetical protein [Eubacteriales bacterium]